MYSNNLFNDAGGDVLSTAEHASSMEVTDEFLTPVPQGLLEQRPQSAVAQGHATNKLLQQRAYAAQASICPLVVD